MQEEPEARVHLDLVLAEGEYALPDFIVTARCTMGSSIASMRSPMFSMMTGKPFSIERSSTCTMSLLPSRVTCRPRSFSRSLSHATPWSCGSMSSGQRFEQLTIAPFSELTGSDGRPCVFHAAISASDVMIESTFASGFIGTGWPPAAVRRYGSHVSSSSAMRNGLVNGPMYEMNADASSTSPTSSSPAAWRSVMPFAQRTSSSRARR